MITDQSSVVHVTMKSIPTYPDNLTWNVHVPYSDPCFSSLNSHFPAAPTTPLLPLESSALPQQLYRSLELPGSESAQAPHCLGLISPLVGFHPLFLTMWLYFGNNACIRADHTQCIRADHIHQPSPSSKFASCQHDLPLPLLHLIIPCFSWKLHLASPLFV